MKKLAIALFGVFCGVSAYASGGVVGAPAQIASNGFFVTGDFGYGRLFTTNSNLDPSAGGSYDRDHYGWSGGVGYNFALDSFNMVGLEADYMDLGQSVYNSSASVAPNDGNLTINSDAAALLLDYTTIWNNGLDLFLKLGAAYIWQNNSYSGTATIVNDNGTFTRFGSFTYQHIEPAGVVGFGYYLMNNLNLFVDATVVAGNTPQAWNKVKQSGDIATIDNWWSVPALSAQLKVGLSYQF